MKAKVFLTAAIIAALGVTVCSKSDGVQPISSTVLRSTLVNIHGLDMERREVGTCTGQGKFSSGLCFLVRVESVCAVGGRQPADRGAVGVCLPCGYHHSKHPWEVGKRRLRVTPAAPRIELVVCKRKHGACSTCTGMRMNDAKISRPA